MADVFIRDDVANSWGRLVETAYDRMVEFALRSMPQFRQVVDKRPGQQAMPGDTITLTLHKDLTPTTTALTETVDPDATGVTAPDRVSVTLVEHGISTIMTNWMRKVAFTNPDAERAELLARHQADSIDLLLKNLFDTGTNVLYNNGGTWLVDGARTSVDADDTLGANGIAIARTILSRANVVPKDGRSYVAYVHPDVATDIRREASGNTWVDAQQYTNSTPIYIGEVGTYAGVRFIETPRCEPFANSGADLDGAGAGTAQADVYPTYVFGKQAIVEAVAEEPHTVVGPQVDKLRRFFPLGWYGILGWSLYRSEALLRIETGSSMQAVLATA